MIEVEGEPPIPFVGCFQFLPDAPPDAVSVELAWVEGERTARVHAPSQIRQQMDEEHITLPFGPMRIEVAISLALFVALSAGLPMILTGDAQVWQAAWGPLLD
jgi:hypothetical protein